MVTDERSSKRTIPRWLSAIVDTAIYIAGIAGPLLLLAAGLWLVFNLVRFLVDMFG